MILLRAVESLQYSPLQQPAMNRLSPTCFLIWILGCRLGVAFCNFAFTILGWFSLCLITSSLQAQNPIVPPGVYIADPSAHVWQDGRLYVYGSTDERPNHFCSFRHDVISSADLVHWTLVTNVFASRGPSNQVPYANAPLFAPDCQYKNGVYYLYHCMPGDISEGVATSVSPVGPFVHSTRMKLYGLEGIDPCVFMDDDRQAYYIWGQFGAKMAKLKPDMTELDPATIHDNVVTEKEHFFHEGGYLVKHAGTYYFVYTHMGRASRPTCLGYATSKSPMGPFTYRGVIIDNSYCDPGNWNNHGSLVEFKGRWYVLYHRSTHGSFTMRKTCVEPITFNPDESINEVEMTTQGALGPLNPIDKMEAERACLLHGNVRVQALAPDNDELAGIKAGDCAAYKYFDFGAGVGRFTVCVALGAKPGTIDVALDNPWGASIGSVSVPDHGSSGTWQKLSCAIGSVKGVHAIWLRFDGEGDNLFQVDWFQFARN